MISAHNISKTFKLYQAPSDRLKEIILRRSYHKEYHALRDISFEVRDGETLGIVGQNGAGKSTLLKILTGVLIPDSGKVTVDGRITGLLELGTGFNPEFSGKDNIFLNGGYLGLSRREIEERFERIVEFTELDDFIDESIKTYSSGMIMRLAFSVAIHADPSAFVIDEALSVGDAYFQQKCMRKIREFKERGGSIIFVSHDMNAVKVLCDKAVLLNYGEIVDTGEPEAVINRYSWLVSTLSDENNRVRKDKGNDNSYGTFEGRIIDVSLRGKEGELQVVVSGEEVEIVVEIESKVNATDLTSGILIRDRFGQDIFGTNTLLNGIALKIHEGKKYRIVYRLLMNIGPGKYTISSALQKDPFIEARRLHWVDKVTTFEVVADNTSCFRGICRLTPEIAIEEQ